MIKARELRVHNLVIRNGQVYEVTGIDFDDDDIYQGIPLTAGNLESFGFEHTDGYKVNGGEIDVDVFELGWFKCSVASVGKVAFSMNSFDVPHVQHVHQLQNFYFAVTGKELIKE